MVKHLISDQISYRKQLQVLDGRYVHKHYSHAHTYSCTPTQMRRGRWVVMDWPAQEHCTCLLSQAYSFPPVGTGSLHSEGQVLDRGPNASSLQVSQEMFLGSHSNWRVKKKISGGSNRSWAHIPGWPWPPTQGRLETGPAVAEDGDTVQFLPLQTSAIWSSKSLKLTAC